MYFSSIYDVKRIFLISLFFILSVTNISVAAVTCSTTVPAGGCEAGCYENSGTCTPCPNGTFSPRNSKQSDACKNCENIPSGATSTGPGKQKDSCPWEITCNAGTEWNWDSKQCTPCTGNDVLGSQSTIKYEENGTVSYPGYSAQPHCTSCGTVKYANDTHTSCLPHTFKIKLEKNCTICTVKDGEFFEKYEVGFSNTENGPFVSGDKFTANLSELDTSRWFGYKLTGYYTEDGFQVLTENGKLVEAYQKSTAFTQHTNLKAHWDGKEYNVHYSGENAPTQQSCKFGKKCTISSPTGTKQCHVFNGWKCTSGCKEQITVEPNTTFDDNNINGVYQITLTAQWSICPKGYFCKDGNATECPAGSTTLNTASKCATIKNDCYISKDTQFKDKDGAIFTLPIGTINYQP